MKNNENSPTPRYLAHKSLVSCAKCSKYTNLEIDASLSREKLSEADRSLYTALVYGVTEKKITLDYIIKTLSDRPMEKIDINTVCAVELGLYQLLFMDRIPDHAAVSETVEVCPKSSRSFVNALLRTFIRKGKKYPLPEDKRERISVEYSVPEWLISFWEERYGEEKALSLCESTSHHPKRVSLRVNTLRTDSRRCVELLGEGAEISPYDGDVILFSGDTSLMRRGIGEGLWFVEDVASRLAVKCLSPRCGDTVIDCCSAPGGKSFSIAIDMENSGKLYSFDLHENKLSLIRKGAERLGISVIETEARDARTPDTSLAGTADCVLCDVPCSGLGVIAKKPDIKYKAPEDISRLAEIQYSILNASCAYVKSGGTLVYSTCTLNPDENEKIFTRFLREHSEFSPRDFSFGDKVSSEGMTTFFPDEGEYDGFFVARARRNDTND